MHTIYKYASFIQDKIMFRIPKGAQFLSVQEQDGALSFWFMVDITEPTEERSFVVYGTGHQVGIYTGKHLGTVQKNNFVWHVFEEIL